MEVISFHLDTISRGKGRSVVQTAAYCAREKYRCDYTGKTYDFSKRRDLVYHGIMLPENAPAKYNDAELLWNDVEQVERCKNSRLARSIIIAIPNELDRSEQINLIRNYVEKTFVRKGMCADISIHDKGDGNPHAHILLTTRSIGDDGRWLNKQRRNYLLDENGNRIIDPVTKKYLLGKSIKTNDWDEREKIDEWREEWAIACNEAYRAKGVKKEVSHLRACLKSFE